MAEVFYSETALEDAEKALRVIDDYFFGKDSPELAEKHKDLFDSELLRQEKLLSEFPELYAEHEGFKCGPHGAKVRVFHVHWFVAFYTYEQETNAVCIWYLRLSKSDYSGLFAVR
ncbi:MAG: type II toxin-antitoxin system RelE/ParE family toxin [Clostridiales Family XIII bacterium]|nr:type II toxin-antitoxin system RelE/ParE family toxin [Clostridiales Family XIII bacterium]